MKLLHDDDDVDVNELLFFIFIFEFRRFVVVQLSPSLNPGRNWLLIKARQSSCSKTPRLAGSSRLPAASLTRIPDDNTNRPSPSTE